MIDKLLILTLLLASVQAGVYHKHNHDISTGARCLDGSPSAIYVHEGQVPENIMIYFLGGGFCEGSSLSEVTEDCYKRSNSILGSSTLLPPTVDSDAFGVLSSLQSINPVFWNWTKVFVHYCDGTFHEGSRAEPVHYKNKNIYFRGTNNTLQHFKYLDEKYNLYNANKVVVTGESAGGIATYLWGDHVYKKSVNKQVYSIPDSGLFLIDYPNPKTGNALFPVQLNVLFNLVNTQVDLPLQDCVAATGSSYQCMNLSNGVQYFKAPLFIVEAGYDEYSVGNIVGEKCIQLSSIHAFYSLDKCSEDDRIQINNYRTQAIKAINNFTVLQQFGAWVPSCVQHTFIHDPSWNSNVYKVPSSTGITLCKAIENFLKNPFDKSGNIHIDSVEWPLNEGCSGHHKSASLRNSKRSMTDLLLQTLSSE